MMGTKLAASAGASQPIEISHPQKMFWPDEGYTKQHLAEYYRRVFPKLSPYVTDRLLTLERCHCRARYGKPQGLTSATRLAVHRY
jgi:DNA primase